MLNQFHIVAACLGNHDFDFGLPQLEKLLAKTTFPWILSNVLNEDGSPAGPKVDRYLILEHGGLRLGLIGLVEE